MCLAQGHNTVTLVGFEPRTSRFGVRRSTTTPPRSNKSVVSTQLKANTPDLTNIKHYCVVNPGSQLPLNVTVSFDFESTIMPSRYFF